MIGMRKDRIVSRALILLIGLIGMSSLAYGAWSLEGFVLTDDSIVSFHVELEEAGVIDRVEADGVSGFTIFRVVDEVKEPVLRISDLSKARGEQLSPGVYWVAPQLSRFVPEEKVLAEVGKVEDKEVKAYVRIIIVSMSEEGIW